MGQIEHSAVRLAARHPESALPCPVCAATVKGANLARHLGKVHPGKALDRQSAEPSWRGPDRVIARALVAVALLAIAGVAAAAWAAGKVHDALILSVVGIAGLALLLVGLVLSGAPLFSGKLLVRDEGFVLSHTLGLRRRRLSHVDRVEAGSAYLVRSSGSNSEGIGGTTSEEKSGIYLRLRDGRRYITVRCKHSAGLRKTWAGWEQARRSRRWHITLDPADFVALQYALFDRGLLTLRE